MQVLLNTLKNKKVIPNNQAANTLQNLRKIQAINNQNKTVYELNELARNFASVYEVSPEQALEFLFLAAEQNISQLIYDKKITETQLANACKCDVKTLRNRIYSPKTLTAGDLHAICSELNITLKEITDSSVFTIAY